METSFSKLDSHGILSKEGKGELVVGTVRVQLHMSFTERRAEGAI